MKPRNDVHPFLHPLLDSILDKCRLLTWSEREEVIGAATVAIFKGRNLPVEIDAAAEFPKVIAAVIAELGTPPVTEEPQAFLYSLSSVKDHVEEGEAWMEDNPGETPLSKRHPFTNGAS